MENITTTVTTAPEMADLQPGRAIANPATTRIGRAQVCIVSIMARILGMDISAIQTVGPGLPQHAIIFLS